MTEPKRNDELLRLTVRRRKRIPIFFSGAILAWQIFCFLGPRWGQKIKITGGKMKTLLASLVFAAGISISCLSSAATVQIPMNGVQNTLSTMIRGEITHTEYRTEQVEATCYETVHVGSEQVCHEVGGGQECGITPEGRKCHSLPSHSECHSEARYEERPYTCYRTEQIAFPVKDYDVENEVTVILPDARELGVLSESLLLNQSGERLHVEARNTSKKVLIYAEVIQEPAMTFGLTKRLSSVVKITVLDRQKYIGAATVPMSDLSVEKESLVFTAGEVTDPRFLNLDVDFRVERWFRDDEILVGRRYNASELVIENLGNGQSKIIFDFAKLGILEKLKGKSLKFHVTMKMEIPRENLVNTQDVPQLSVRKTLKKSL